MFENLIPNAYAQSTQIRDAATAAESQGKAGITELFKFFADNVGNWLAALIIVAMSWVIAKMASAALRREIIKKKEGEVQESVLILVERITTIAVLTVGVTIAAAINGLNFTAVIGAISLGIGFALKDIIGNFISGIIMLSQDRIRIGDLIRVGEILGTIVSIDTRATVLQSIDGTEVVIPNQSMLNETLISYSTNPFRRIELIVGVDYKTDLPMVTSLIKGILDKDKDIVPKPESLVLVDEFSDSSINIKVLFWIESTKNWLKIRSNLAHRIKMTFNELGINIPFPIRTLKLDEDDRSFLKTMDSMKKGVVPDVAKVPDKEMIKTAAQHTEGVSEIPETVFEKSSRKSAEPQVDPQPTPFPPAPQPVKKKEDVPPPPPTHL